MFFVCLTRQYFGKRCEIVKLTQIEKKSQRAKLEDPKILKEAS
jgi:hypothetical protein